MSAEPERPSARAVERLATGVGGDVTDLRTQLHRALDEAERLQAVGRGDLAVSVLQEQRDMLLEVHQRLEARLAEAAVEREAERVVDAAAPVLDPAEAGPTPLGVSSDDGMALRLVASAVAAVLGVALLLSPELGAGGLTAAGSTAATDALQDATAPGAGDAARVASTTTPTASADHGRAAVAATTDLSELALPEADLLPVTTPEQDEAEDGDPTDTALVPLPDVSRTIDELTPGTPSLPAADADEGGEQEATESDGDGRADADDGTNAGDDTAEDAPTDDASEDAGQDGQTARSSEDDAAGADADGGGSSDAGSTDDGSTDDGSTAGGKTGDGGGSVDVDGGDPSGGGLDVDDTDGEPMSLER